MSRSKLVVGAGLAAALLFGGMSIGADRAVAATACTIGVEYLADGTFLITNGAGDAGCVTTHHIPFGGAWLDHVDANPGWTYQVKSNGGATDKSKVEVEFKETATGRTVKYMIRLGRVIVSG